MPPAARAMTSPLDREPEVADLARRRQRPSREEQTAHLGTVVFLGSWAMLFASLFFAYGLVRLRAPSWPPAGQPELPLLLPGVNTLLALGASVAVAAAVRAWGSRGSRVAAALAAAAALGAGFLAVQAAVWTRLLRGGLAPSDGPYASVFYAFTGFHGLHVAVGVVALAALAVRALRPGGVGRAAVRLWALYWHFVGVVWAVLYVTVFVL
ncbi:cytochrome c oxidase subunit 3 [Anaeromyxobacter diazotrophicus]|uniref:Cytochrome b6 n=1 Tax=Anaeromyxobacter diazotrophicus TaxID=2590199 RepID=A0A7I9VKZ0_9BACT|nr:cytochrome c oxidase subunit 3 [Anaeromyxobacter diazotrophicus]GEJ56790.1 cytochrome b6 [Anaeromyxobacter diazotrophicus]